MDARAQFNHELSDNPPTVMAFSRLRPGTPLAKVTALAGVGDAVSRSVSGVVVLQQAIRRRPARMALFDVSDIGAVEHTTATAPSASASASAASAATATATSTTATAATSAAAPSAVGSSVRVLVTAAPCVLQPHGPSHLRFVCFVFVLCRWVGLLVCCPLCLATALA